MRTASEPGLTHGTPRGEASGVVDTCRRVEAQVDLLKQGNTWALSLFQFHPGSLCKHVTARVKMTPTAEPPGGTSGSFFGGEPQKQSAKKPLGRRAG